MLANDTETTLNEAKRLFKAVDRPNVMIKVPGTVEGAPAVQELLTAGINVNITLLFSIENYERVINAYLAALEARAAAGKPLDHIASVASFFVSRVDTAADKLIDAKVEEVGGANTSEGHTLLKLRGKVAIANAKLAYELFQQYFSSDRFKALAAKGARPQRPLWASTGTKDKAYSDILYVESLIGPETINTVPPATLAAFRDHGTVARTIDTDLDGARETLKELAAAGISLDGITQKLEDDGIEAFAKSFDDLLAGVEEKRAQLR
jgi:transaldolase